MWLYGVYCKYSHIDLKFQRILGSCTHNLHSPHLFATGSSDGGVLLCSVERCSAGRSSQNKQQEESDPLSHSCDLFHLFLSFTLIPTVCQAERRLPFIEHPPHSTAPGPPVKGIGMLLVILSVASSPVGSTSAHYCIVCSLVFGVFIHSKLRMWSTITVCSPLLSTWGSALIHVGDILCNFYRHQCTQFTSAFLTCYTVFIMPQHLVSIAVCFHCCLLESVG